MVAVVCDKIRAPGKVYKQMMHSKVIGAAVPVAQKSFRKLTDEHMRAVFPKPADDFRIKRFYTKGTVITIKHLGDSSAKRRTLFILCAFYFNYYRNSTAYDIKRFFEKRNMFAPAEDAA